MPDQTPVQISSMTHEVDATEKALSILSGAETWVRTADPGAPYLEIADVAPQVRAFFDYVKQEQE